MHGRAAGQLVGEAMTAQREDGRGRLRVCAAAAAALFVALGAHAGRASPPGGAFVISAGRVLLALGAGLDVVSFCTCCRLRGAAPALQAAGCAGVWVGGLELGVAVPYCLGARSVFSALEVWAARAAGRHTLEAGLGCGGVPLLIAPSRWWLCCNLHVHALCSSKAARGLRICARIDHLAPGVHLIIRTSGPASAAANCMPAVHGVRVWGPAPRRLLHCRTCRCVFSGIGVRRCSGMHHSGTLYQWYVTAVGAGRSLGSASGPVVASQRR